MTKLMITDTVLRDAHQFLLATRMRTEDMIPICEKLDVQYAAHAVAMSRAKERVVLERMSKSDPWIDGDLSLAIEDKKSGECLGSVGLHRISKQNRNAELGIVILDPKNFGKGYGTMLLRSCCGSGSTSLDLRVYTCLRFL